jgi:hypothetical protein
MRFGICVPNLAEFADPRQVAALARRAERAGRVRGGPGADRGRPATLAAHDGVA